MAVYWTAKSYKFDSSYITGEIKSRGYYEFNLDLAEVFTGTKVEFRHGVDLFHEIMDSKFIYENFGLCDKNQLDFYYNSDDFIDGTNIRRIDDSICGMLYKPDKILKALQQIATHTHNFTSVENSESLLALIEMLRTAKEENQLIHCFWTE